MGVPSDPEDPRPTGALSDEFEEAAPSNQYFTKRDLRYIAIGLLVVLIACYPLYLKLKADRDRYQCALNFKAMGTAMGQYLTDNDESFPPTFVHDGDSPYPKKDDKGRPITWASTLVGLSGFDLKKYSFVCPSADTTELMVAEGPQGSDLKMSYGMYEALDTVPQKSVSNLGRVVLVTETSSNGAINTYDPKPMSQSAQVTGDGFLVGWSSGDFAVPTDGKVPPPSVTRVSVRDTKDGLTNSIFADGRQPQSRHDDRIHVLFADGHYGLIKVGYLLNANSWMIPQR